MALIIPPGFLHAVYELKLVTDPEVMVVTMGHEIDDASGSSGTAAPSDLFNAFATHVMPSVNSGYQLLGVTCYVGNDGPVNVEYSTNPLVTGGSNTAAMPPNCALLVRKRTDLGGRRGRGRIYLPGLNETTVDEVGNLSTIAQTAWQQVMTAWFNKLTVSAPGLHLYPPVVLHRSEGEGVEPPPTPVATLVVERKIATQRRRLRP